MKIMICGSMGFSKEMLHAKKSLEELGHFVEVPCDVESHIENSDLIDDLDADFEHCVKNNVLKTCMDSIADSDAILIVNHDKNGIKGYIGTSAMIEMGLAYYLGKKIFLLFPTPSPSETRWAHEVRIMQPVIINGDFSMIQ
ncbi:MAG: hypothetical protein HY365_02160 [Candidatus Aenigmarchaeota archaeon]|nr:hypothetical protein [Candidatus Aenigmarchaeota archaeon]